MKWGARRARSPSVNCSGTKSNAVSSGGKEGRCPADRMLSHRCDTAARDGRNRLLSQLELGEGDGLGEVDGGGLGVVGGGLGVVGEGDGEDCGTRNNVTNDPASTFWPGGGS